MMAHEPEEKESIPFFIIVVVVMFFLYAWTLHTNPGLRSLPKLAFFSAGMGLHTILHWMYRYISKKANLTILYFCFQSLLAAVLIIYTGEVNLLFGLYLALLGEEAGYFRRIKTIVLIVAVNILLIAAILFIKMTSSTVNFFFFIGIIPMILFVIIYVNLYRKQLDAKVKARKLLSELKLTNKKLSKSNAMVEELTREKERQRIARELHDTLAQGLTGIILQLEAVNAFLDIGRQDKALEIIGKSMKKARETLSEARGVIDDLRQTAFREISFNDFIRDEVAGIILSSGFRIDIDTSKNVNLPTDVKVQLMKIVSEGLRNCAEHSGADNVKLSISTTDDGIELTIADDGMGFDPASIGSGHYGLVGMKERSNLLGGTFSIESFPGKGTKLFVEIPGDFNER